MFLQNFQELVLKLVGYIDAKGINVVQPIWSWGCPTWGQNRAKNEKLPKDMQHSECHDSKIGEFLNILICLYIISKEVMIHIEICDKILSTFEWPASHTVILEYFNIKE